jgi:hypothetical protein
MTTLGAEPGTTPIMLSVCQVSSRPFYHSRLGSSGGRRSVAGQTFQALP